MVGKKNVKKVSRMSGALFVGSAFHDPASGPRNSLISLFVRKQKKFYDKDLQCFSSLNGSFSFS
ncbi:hypothetical protein AS030_08620 [Fictibacillus enclensis]|uniref:Uncharacterized protein n=1 Tax=Fictibacillus enclensis TaxID=1017270 RepID=A0A0V8JF76_9BACL|nr:hypothetical protein AS030_08620 [Fictibacillus enclensis]